MPKDEHELIKVKTKIRFNAPNPPLLYTDTSSNLNTTITTNSTNSWILDEEYLNMLKEKQTIYGIQEVDASKYTSFISLLNNVGISVQAFNMLLDAYNKLIGNGHKTMLITKGGMYTNGQQDTDRNNKG